MLCLQFVMLLAKEYNKEVTPYPAKNVLQAIHFFDPKSSHYTFTADAPSIDELQESISDPDILTRIDEFLHQWYVVELLLFVSCTEKCSYVGTGAES